MADSHGPAATTLGERLKAWWASPTRVQATLAAAAPALLLVPLLLTTITALLAPAPWGVPEARRGPVLVAAFVGWVVLPVAVGAWRRRWWWWPLCLAAVLATAASWGGKLVVGGYGEDGHGAPPATVEVLQPALALGALAALLGAADVALAPVLDRLSPRVRHGLVAAGLTAGIVPVVVAWVVIVAVSVDAGLAGSLSALSLLVAATYGPYQAGRWIGQGWWALACFLIPASLVWYWGSGYVEAVPNLSRDEWILNLFFSVYGTVAAVGALQNSPTGLALPRSGPTRRF